MSKTPKYRGFSTQAWVDGENTLIVEDAACVKRDLLNHIYTTFGDRVHMAYFGTTVPELPHEPLDEKTVTRIRKELGDVFNYDPRVVVNTFDLYAVTEQNAIAAIADLFYVELGTNEQLRIDIALDQHNIQ